MLAPFLLLFLGFFIYPFFYAVYLSVFASKQGLTRFAGLSNYALALTDPQFWSSIRTVVYFGLLQAVAVLLVGLVLALILDSPLIRGSGLFRLVYFLPYAVPGVIAAIMWGFLYSPSLDPLMTIFTHSAASISGGNLIYYIVNIVAWEFAGYNMTLYFAALTALPLEIYEAAKLDGCTELQLALRIKLPLLRPMIIFTSILSIIGSLQLFNEPYVLSNLANVPPGYTPNLYIYNYAFTYGNFNYAAALSCLLAALTFIASMVFFFFVTRGQRQAARLERRRRSLLASRDMPEAPRLGVGI